MPSDFADTSGWSAAIALTLFLSAWHHLPLWGWMIIMAASVGVFFSFAMLTKVLTGQENLVYHHHELAVLGTAFLLVRALGQPVLLGLDITMLGIGAFLVSGRIGCLMVGCCHGRPSGWGVCYTAAHAATGFPSYYIGLRLFPIQAIESFWVVCVVVVGCALLLNGAPPGTALAWYFVMYSGGRFCFEFLRGDPQRRYLGSFSEAQWTSLVLVTLMSVAELTGMLTFHMWHLVVAIGIALAMVVITLRRRYWPAPRDYLLQPRHVHEVAAILAQIEEDERGGLTMGEETRPAGVLVGTTSLGIQLSGGALDQPHSHSYHYTCSSDTTPLSREAAETLAGLIVQLRRIVGAIDVIERTKGIFHLLVRPAT